MPTRAPGGGSARVAAALSLLLGTALLAGCLQDGDDGAPGRPRAVLRIDRAEEWNNETVVLDGRNSTVEDGRILLYRLDAGDGTVYEASEAEEARARHRYAHGGVYNVTLRVTAVDAEGDNRTDETAEQLTVHERLAIEPQTLHAVPPGGDDDHRTELPFEARAGASAWEVAVTAENVRTSGPAQLWVRILDDQNETLAEETWTLEARASENVTLAGDEPAPGPHRLIIEANEGDLRVEGRLAVRYAPD